MEDFFLSKCYHLRYIYHIHKHERISVLMHLEIRLNILDLNVLLIALHLWILLNYLASLRLHWKIRKIIIFILSICCKDCDTGSYCNSLNVCVLLRLYDHQVMILGNEAFRRFLDQENNMVINPIFPLMKEVWRAALTFPPHGDTVRWCHLWEGNWVLIRLRALYVSWSFQFPEPEKVNFCHLYNTKSEMFITEIWIG